MTVTQPSVLEQLQMLFRDDLGIIVVPGESDLLGHGVLDSLQLVELFLALERRFGVRMDLGAVSFEHFRSLESIAAYVEGARRSSAAT